MNLWGYEIYDKTTHVLLKADLGFETESDAELQAQMDAKADALKGYYIRTTQKWVDL